MVYIARKNYILYPRLIKDYLTENLNDTQLTNLLWPSIRIHIRTNISPLPINIDQTITTFVILTLTGKILSFDSYLKAAYSQFKF